jgi:transposase
MIHSFIEACIDIALCTHFGLSPCMRTPENGKEAERRRVRALALVQQGLSSAAIGHRLGIDPRTVRRWKARFRRRGRRGLQTRPAPGARCRLTKQQRNGLTQRLLAGARAQGFTSDLWTCPRIALLIEQQYQVHYHVDHIPRLMRSLGFSVQKPQRQARERDEGAIRDWIDRDWKRIKKRPPPVRAPSFSSTKQAFS